MIPKELINNILKYATIENISDVHIITNDKVKIRDKN
jgi:type II secretory ATPase GspE/PulE/Tfp pilus assembly ATPase PilB-like protein